MADNDRKYPGANWTAGILTLRELLIAKGVITDDEWEAEFARQRESVIRDMGGQGSRLD